MRFRLGSFIADKTFVHEGNEHICTPSINETRFQSICEFNCLKVGVYAVAQPFGFDKKYDAQFKRN